MNSQRKDMTTDDIGEIIGLHLAAAQYAWCAKQASWTSGVDMFSKEPVASGSVK